ncbi:uncharacterized protein LOC122375192 [Amphibalanus amphitrite]|uniref:uncharacterized protein LOC122375192 n=1 Tax=Amphibalanus amphitrite TaxID=1232801 RepID=UPI001C91B03E|nr:uncharacterized protein LOC122375192 [Amphibalanus amphitrite]
MIPQSALKGGRRCSRCPPPTNCCQLAVLRSAATAVSVSYITINAVFIISFVLYIVYCSIVLPTEERDKLYFLSYIFIGVLMLGGANLAFDSALLRGVRAARRPLVLGWVVWYGVLTALLSVGWVAGAIVWIYLVVMSRPSDVALGVFFTCVHCLLGFAVLPLMWFCFACVASHLSTLTPSDDNVLISKLVRQNTRFGLVTLPPHEEPDDD